MVQPMNAAMIDLKAELYRKQEEYRQVKGHKIFDCAPCLTERSGYVRKSGRVPKNSCPKNCGVDSRAAKDEADVATNDNDLMKKSRDILHAKSILYDKMSALSSADIPGNDDSDGYLVDFQLKAMDRLSKHNQSKVLGQQQQQDAGLCGSDQIMPMMSVDNMCAFDEHHGSNRQEHFDRHVTAAVASDHDDDTLAGDEEWVDYVDVFGRSRRCVKIDLPERYAEVSRGTKSSDSCSMLNSLKVSAACCSSADTMRQLRQQGWSNDVKSNTSGPVHYANVQFDEVRTHGTGYYQFSKDSSARAEEMKMLSELTKETSVGRDRSEQVKQEKKAALEVRLAKVRKRHRLTGGSVSGTSCDSVTSSTCVSIDNSGVLLEQELLIADSCHDNTRHRSLSVREWDVGKEVMFGWQRPSAGPSYIGQNSTTSVVHLSPTAVLTSNCSDSAPPFAYPGSADCLAMTIVSTAVSTHVNTLAYSEGLHEAGHCNDSAYACRMSGSPAGSTSNTLCGTVCFEAATDSVAVCDLEDIPLPSDYSGADEVKVHHFVDNSLEMICHPPPKSADLLTVPACLCSNGGTNVSPGDCVPYVSAGDNMLFISPGDNVPCVSACDVVCERLDIKRHSFAPVCCDGFDACAGQLSGGEASGLADVQQPAMSPAGNTDGGVVKSSVNTQHHDNRLWPDNLGADEDSFPNAAVNKKCLISYASAISNLAVPRGELRKRSAANVLIHGWTRHFPHDSVPVCLSHDNVFPIVSSTALSTVQGSVRQCQGKRPFVGMDESSTNWPVSCLPVSLVDKRFMQNRQLDDSVLPSVTTVFTAVTGQCVEQPRHIAFCTGQAMPCSSSSSVVFGVPEFLQPSVSMSVCMYQAGSFQAARRAADCKAEQDIELARQKTQYHSGPVMYSHRYNS